MTIEQAQHLRVVWQSKGSSFCRHPETEHEYYEMGEATGYWCAPGVGIICKEDLKTSWKQGRVVRGKRSPLELDLKK